MNKILLVALLLVGCGKIEQRKTRLEVVDHEWDKAEMINVRYYKTNIDSRFLQTFEMDEHKFVIYTNGRGSAMVAIPLNKKYE